MHRTVAGGDDDRSDERLVFRRGRLRTREDDEVRMMRDALAHLEDIARVKRLLLELSRFYNPVTDGPVVGPDIRHAVIASLERGDMDAARSVLDAHLTRHLNIDEPK